MKTKLQMTDSFSGLYSERIKEIPRSFLREILKLTGENQLISFAGGLPNPEYFPVQDLRKAAEEIWESDINHTLQYSTSEGYYPLRKWIADNYYKKYGWEVSPEEILITSGSQQGLDLAGKVFINRQDKILLERPSYLGAIQALSLHQPEFLSCSMDADGLNLSDLTDILNRHKIKLIYLIPDFQNPTGICYSENKRKNLAKILEKSEGILIEDNPYGEICFSKKRWFPIKYYSERKSIILGSFSKVISPGLRTGWIYAPKEIMEKLIIAKQASDLHSNLFSQKIIYNYLAQGKNSDHIQRIIESYQRNCMIMLQEIKKCFPPEVKVLKPEGGMFIWAKLPERYSAWDLLDISMQNGIAFVPGSTFYLKGEEENNSLRLNYTGSSEREIKKGIQLLGMSIKQLLKEI